MKKAFRSMGPAIVFAVIALLGLLAFIRLAPSDPAVWHVDPLTLVAPSRPNHWLLSAPPLALTMTAQEAATKISAIAKATPRTALLAGQGLHTTWITRSAVMGYPDYTSVMITPASSGSTIAVFARARFGHSDLGVNRARVESWLNQLVQ